MRIKSLIENKIFSHFINKFFSFDQKNLSYHQKFEMGKKNKNSLILYTLFLTYQKKKINKGEG